MSRITLNLHFLHLIQFCVESNGLRFFPFQKDARFVLWANNIKYRHMMTEQGTIYLKQNPGDANMTVDQLKQQLSDCRRNDVLQRMCRYIANIPGIKHFLTEKPFLIRLIRIPKLLE